MGPAVVQVVFVEIVPETLVGPALNAAPGTTTTAARRPSRPRAGNVQPTVSSPLALSRRSRRYPSRLHCEGLRSDQQRDHQLTNRNRPVRSVPHAANENAAATGQKSHRRTLPRGAIALAPPRSPPTIAGRRPTANHRSRATPIPHLGEPRVGIASQADLRRRLTLCWKSARMGALIRFRREPPASATPPMRPSGPTRHRWTYEGVVRAFAGQVRSQADVAVLLSRRVLRSSAVDFLEPDGFTILCCRPVPGRVRG